MSRFLSLILLFACLALIAWFLPSARNPNHNVGAGETKNFAELTEPTGGDQIMLMKWPRGAWSEAVAVTEKGGDLQ
ncbi:MAG: hypothetical protein ACREA2_04060 [Blastocatellia bacterium]